MAFMAVLTLPPPEPLDELDTLDMAVLLAVAAPPLPMALELVTDALLEEEAPPPPGPALVVLLCEPELPSCTAVHAPTAPTQTTKDARGAMVGNCNRSPTCYAGVG
jgi:hypothetical protein